MDTKNTFKKYLFFSIAEFIILIIYCVSLFLRTPVNVVYESKDLIYVRNDVEVDYPFEFGPEDSVYIKTPGTRLHKGIYNVNIDYSCDGDNNILKVGGAGSGYLDIKTDEAYLANYKNHETLEVWTYGDVSSLFAQVNYGNAGSILIENLSINEAWNSGLYFAFIAFLIAAAINLLAYLILFRKEKNIDLVPIMVILGIAVAASAGYMNKGILDGHDLDFHLLRIEGIKDAILQGQFPVRIQPNWCNGWGYPVSIMYGDLTLSIPALLRIIGFSVQASFKGFILVINLLTACSAYYCFEKIGKDKVIGLVLSAAYTLSVYRMCNVYIRGGIGEIGAILFLPFIALFIYYAFTVTEEDALDYKKIAVGVIGITGVIQTHVLSVYMVIIFGVIIACICFKKLADKSFWKFCLITGAWSILINIWFLIPFVLYMKEPLSILNEEVVGDIASRGITLQELFMPFYNGTYIFRWDAALSYGTTYSISAGYFCIIMPAVFIMMEPKWQMKKTKKPAFICLVVTILSIFMSTNVFPYGFFADYLPIISKVIAKGKLPYRYLEISIVAACFLAAFVLRHIKKKNQADLFRLVVALIALVSVLQGMQYVYTVIVNSGIKYKYSESSLNTADIMGAEYLYLGSDVQGTYMTRSVTAAGTDITEWNKEGLKFTVSLQNTGSEAYIDIPVFYYRDVYKAEDKAQKIKFEVIRDTEHNNCLKVMIPEGYSGTLVVKEHEPVKWIVLDVISLLSLIAFIIWGFRRSDTKRVADSFTYYGSRVKEVSVDSAKFLSSKFVLLCQSIKAFFFRNGWIFTVTSVLVILVLFAGILILNLNTGFTSDDPHYFAFIDTMSGPIESSHKFRITELISSMHNHRQIINGRVVAHGLLQIALLLPRVAYRVLNSLMFVALILLIYFHSVYGKTKKSVSLIALIGTLLWFFAPDFGHTVLWASGAASYLWCSVIILFVLVPYRINSANDDKMKDDLKNFILMLLVGMIGGCTNENSGGALVGLCILYVIGYYISKRKIKKWMISGIVGEIIGMLYLVTAPQRLDSKTDLEGYIARFKDILVITKRDLGVLFIIFTVVAVAYIALEKYRETDEVSYIPFFMLLAGCASIVVLTFAFSYPERAFFAGTILVISAISYLYNDVICSVGIAAGLIVTLALLSVTFFSFEKEIPAVKKTYAQYNEGYELIQSAIKRGDKEVEIPIVYPSESRYDAFFGLNYIQESPDDWVNAWLGLYYGLRIKGKPAENNGAQ